VPPLTVRPPKGAGAHQRAALDGEGRRGVAAEVPCASFDLENLEMPVLLRVGAGVGVAQFKRAVSGAPEGENVAARAGVAVALWFELPF